MVFSLLFQDTLFVAAGFQWISNKRCVFIWKPQPAFPLSSQASGESIITHDITYVNVRLNCTLLALDLSLATSTLYIVLC